MIYCVSNSIYRLKKEDTFSKSYRILWKFLSFLGIKGFVYVKDQESFISSQLNKQTLRNDASLDFWIEMYKYAQSGNLDLFIIGEGFKTELYIVNKRTNYFYSFLYDQD